MFINYNQGQITINSYRLPNAAVTDLEDILLAAHHSRNTVLTASTDGALDALCDGAALASIHKDLSEDLVTGLYNDILETLGDE